MPAQPALKWRLAAPGTQVRGGAVSVLPAMPLRMMGGVLPGQEEAPHQLLPAQIMTPGKICKIFPSTSVVTNQPLLHAACCRLGGGGGPEEAACQPPLCTLP